MLFPTVVFAAFFMVVLPLSWLLMGRPKIWKPMIIAASYVFYGYADWRFVPLLAGVTIVAQLAATRIAASDDDVVRKRWVTGAVTADLLALGTFKYAGFGVQQVDDAFGHFGLGAPVSLLHLVLPIGVSFFTFQAISYVVDVHRRATPRASFADAALYLSFFPHLVAGPIVRAKEFVPQLASPRTAADTDNTRAILLILGGLIKKVLLADVLARDLVDPVFSTPGAHSGGEALLAAYGFAMQIWCDFSGYTDMAIGLALLLGFRFPQNFNRPYSATSLQDFWRRWHMTLSRWLRDYLYIPLGGNRGSSLMTYRNLMLTMLLGGLWHGAAWTFVVWGGLHGAGLAVERFVRARRPVIIGGRVGAVVGWLVTFHLVCLAWVFFRAPTVGVAFNVLARLAHPGPVPLATAGILAAIALGMVLQYVPEDVHNRVRAGFAGLPWSAQGLTAGLLLVAVGAAVGEQGVAPFLYFSF